MTNNKKITTLYEHYKNTPKKLKIVCDWDEVIQATEPFSLWKSMNEETRGEFSKTFELFWGNKEKCPIEYSPYGSRLIEVDSKHAVRITPFLFREQQANKNSPHFYQQAPFLTIAEDLLKLIKEDKVERIIFLSAYDKRKFPNGDKRKLDIFHQTFGGNDEEAEKDWIYYAHGDYRVDLCFRLLGFDSETQGQTKADWIKDNASDFDIVIDDNPNICRSLAEAKRGLIEEIVKGNKTTTLAKATKAINSTIIAPYYPAVEHDKRVLLVKNELSGLEKVDFINSKN